MRPSPRQPWKLCRRVVDQQAGCAGDGRPLALRRGKRCLDACALRVTDFAERTVAAFTGRNHAGAGTFVADAIADAAALSAPASCRKAGVRAVSRPIAGFCSRALPVIPAVVGGRRGWMLTGAGAVALVERALIAVRGARCNRARRRMLADHVASHTSNVHSLPSSGQPKPNPGGVDTRLGIRCRRGSRPDPRRDLRCGNCTFRPDRYPSRCRRSGHRTVARRQDRRSRRCRRHRTCRRCTSSQQRNSCLMERAGRSRSNSRRHRSRRLHTARPVRARRCRSGGLGAGIRAMQRKLRSRYDPENDVLDGLTTAVTLFRHMPGSGAGPSREKLPVRGSIVPVQVSTTLPTIGTCTERSTPVSVTVQIAL